MKNDSKKPITVTFSVHVNRPFGYFTDGRYQRNYEDLSSALLGLKDIVEEVSSFDNYTIVGVSILRDGITIPQMLDLIVR